MPAAVLLCLVMSVSDGDTLKVRCADRPAVSVRLAQIDAPERGQPFGRRSRQQLSVLCAGKPAEIRSASLDRYGRIVGQVRCDGVDANSAMVRTGMAWAYGRYLTDPKIRAMEMLARRERLGLWSDANPVPPWIWRKDGGKGGVPRAGSPDRSLRLSGRAAA